MQDTPGTSAMATLNGRRDPCGHRAEELAEEEVYSQGHRLARRPQRQPQTCGEKPNMACLCPRYIGHKPSP
ncbi:hypothetical protein NDU88_006634 [Pleurodeles waltl]|uniref:Uncharacterized protein n=1 Tax=Pleurodeles waltl TaxID=8319 RepID=A0AAV7WY53_PLEWA|nr:hypothetical protein NDU88_006634 [Pleurodeles waltl]